ncbi:MAG TPA: hypothetical protein VF170_11960 [Planctomycetaceae bacterium]
MARAFLLRRLLSCLLALCVGGIGPAAIAAVPRAINPGAEEETRTTAEHAIGGTVLPGSRATRTAAHGDRPGRLTRVDRKPAGGPAPASSVAAAPTLRTLQVRIQI